MRLALVLLLASGTWMAVDHVGPPPTWTVAPYLRHVRADGVTVCFESATPRVSRVRYGPGPDRRHAVTSAAACFHAVDLEGLEPGRVHSYVVEWQDADGWHATAPAPFVTAPVEDVPFTFAVVGDTQDQPTVWRDVAARVQEARPAFVVHVGDLVGNGFEAEAWNRELFGPARELFASAPLLVVPGNHEEDAPAWYRYGAFARGAHTWQRRYGSLELFGVDSNRPCGTGSVQAAWLREALQRSTARWRIVLHHHPVWSSDSDDYGDAQAGVEASGDPRVQDLKAIYEEADVDLVLSGHVHGYERTWPLRGDRVDRERGVTYIVTGGAGGYLDAFGAAPPWFSATVRAVHHHLLVFVEGDRLTVRAHDRKGRLIDELVLTPRERSGALAGARANG